MISGSITCRGETEKNRLYGRRWAGMRISVTRCGECKVEMWVWQGYLCAARGRRSKPSRGYRPVHSRVHVQAQQQQHTGTPTCPPSRVTHHTSVSEHSLRGASYALAQRRGHLVRRGTEACGRQTPRLPRPGFRTRRRSRSCTSVVVAVGEEISGWV